MNKVPAEKLVKVVPEKPFEPCLIVFYEKHSNHNLIAYTKEEFYEIFLFKLKERLNDGWYYKPEIPEEHSTCHQKKINTPELMKQYEREVKKWEEVQKAIKDKDGRLAYSIICSRGSWQYEHFERYDLKDLKLDKRGR